MASFLQLARSGHRASALLSMLSNVKGVQMRRWQALLISMAATMLLASCSRPPFLVLVNNSGHAIEIAFASIDGVTNDARRGRSIWEWAFGLPMRVNQDSSRVLQISPWGGGTWLMTLRARDCGLSYQIPLGLRDQYQSEAWPQLPYDAVGGGDPAVQLEADQTLHLVPLGSQRAWDVETVEELQPAGFPLTPTERVCAGPRP